MIDDRSVTQRIKVFPQLECLNYKCDTIFDTKEQVQRLFAKGTKIYESDSNCNHTYNVPLESKNLSSTSMIVENP